MVKILRILVLILVLLCPSFVTNLNSKVANAEQNIDWKKAENLYIAQCANCHRKNGEGIKNVYPPLKNADYVQKGDVIELLRGMLFGRSGKITVNGKTYQGVMTTEIDKSISDDDIALILTFVLQKLNNKNIQVNPKYVKEARKAGKLPGS